MAQDCIKMGWPEIDEATENIYLSVQGQWVIGFCAILHLPIDNMPADVIEYLSFEN